MVKNYLKLWLFASAGMRGGRCGSPSRKHMGRRVWEMQLHPAEGQNHVPQLGSVYTTCVWSNMPSGETCKVSNMNCAFLTTGHNYKFQGSTYIQSNGECCGKCTTTSCVESKGEMRGDSLTGAKLRQVCMSKKDNYDQFKLLLLFGSELLLNCCCMYFQLQLSN